MTNYVCLIHTDLEAGIIAKFIEVDGESLQHSICWKIQSNIICRNAYLWWGPDGILTQLGGVPDWIGFQRS